MNGNVKNLPIFYGARCEVFDLSRAQSFEEFTDEIFGIDKVFQEKSVVGRCMVPDEEKNIQLSNQQDAEKFVVSRDAEGPRIILIYDKPETEDQSQSDFKVSRRQWEELVNSVKELRLLVEKNQNPSATTTGPVHHGFFCDACYPNEAAKTGTPIVGTRFQCQDCRNAYSRSFDLCSSCKAKGVELMSHKNYHNMTRIDTPLPRRINIHLSEGTGTPSPNWIDNLFESDAFVIFFGIFMILFGICIFFAFIFTIVPVWEVVLQPLARRYMEFLYSTLEYYFNID